MEPTPKLAQLINQRAELDATINAMMREERQTAISNVRQTMAQFGLTVQDISGLPKRVKTLRPPKYKNPVTGETWSGLGKRPAWVNEKLNEGAKLADFLIGALPVAQAPAKKAVAKKATTVARKATKRK